jgi:demethylmenaquinone methyltransferase/2-methoxy-6-polyprenyl-1,4-benzoquinol methylase
MQQMQYAAFDPERRLGAAARPLRERSRDAVDVDEDALLAEQKSFYRARAPEYDEWWQRRGHYERGDQELVEWQHQVGILDAALDAFGARGKVLELAGGTGWWTQRLAETADRLTVVDSSPETLALNRERVGRPDVHYEVADLFDWLPDSLYDVVFFSFWLSHVPRARFGDFWALVRACLNPNGRVFLIDNRNDPLGGSSARDPYVVEYGTDLHLRTLGDGSRYRVVKVMYEPDELEALISTEGWSVEMESTRWFIFGSARRA